MCRIGLTTHIGDHPVLKDLVQMTWPDCPVLTYDVLDFELLTILAGPGYLMRGGHRPRSKRSLGQT